MRTFTVGQQVVNFGIRAVVVGFHPVTGDLILEAPGIGRWIADPEKTEPVQSGWIHKDGLVVI